MRVPYGSPATPSRSHYWLASWPTRGPRGRRWRIVSSGLARIDPGPRRLTMQIKRSGSQPSTKGPADWFTGTVRIDPLFAANAPARAAGNAVTFEPGARTAWHTHPLGQTLIVTFGFGLVQREGGPIEEIRPGDVVWFQAGEKHWHGAPPAPPTRNNTPHT